MIPWKDLSTKYEHHGSDLFRIWFCNRCNNMVRADNMSDLEIQAELIRQERDGVN